MQTKACITSYATNYHATDISTAWAEPSGVGKGGEVADAAEA